MRQRRCRRIVSRLRCVLCIPCASLRCGTVQFSPEPIEPPARRRVLPPGLLLCVWSLQVFTHFATRPPARPREENDVLDERMTLMILAWTVGTVCIATLVLSALSLA